MKGFTGFLLLTITICAGESSAQKASLELTVGTAVSFISKKATNENFSPVIAPFGGLNFYQPITEKLGIKTGLLYQQKGYSYKNQSVLDNSEISSHIKARSSLHYLSIPLQLNLTWNGKKGNIWRTSFGMNYGFLVYAQTTQKLSSYLNGTLLEEKNLSFPNYIASARSRDERRGNDRSELYLFTPSVRGDVTYQFHKKFSVSTFYEYNLSDVSSNGGISRVNLHTVGIYVSYALLRQ